MPSAFVTTISPPSSVSEPPLLGASGFQLAPASKLTRMPRYGT
jgi:hypothetical protein